MRPPGTALTVLAMVLVTVPAALRGSWFLALAAAAVGIAAVVVLVLERRR
jgi:hypothetical protein